MPTREELHKLIDSLPEGAIELAHRDLLNFQVWPPPPPSPPSDVASMKKRLEEEMSKHMESRTKRRAVFGFGGGSYDPARGSGSLSMSSWDGDTSMVLTIQRLQEHELMTIERIRADGQRLIYKHEVTGPGEKRDEREVVFDLPA
jgi:hypothetical protein